MDNKVKVVISGYYGFNNIGDEAILHTMIDMLKNEIPEIDIVVLSNNPKETEQTYNIKAISRWDMKSIIKQIKLCDMLISGGGSLLQDVTSTKTIPYYLGIIKIGLLYRKKVVFYSQGIGPVNKWWNRWFIKCIGNRVDHIFVRESMSAKLLQEIGVKAPISVSIDPVFGIRTDNKLCEEKKNEMVQEKKIGVYLRPWKYSHNMINSTSHALKYFIEEGYTIYLLCMQYEQDIEVAKEIAHKLNHPKVHLINKALTVDETLAYTTQFDFIVSMRLHSLIMAVAVGTPIIALSYDPKVENVMSEMGINHAIKLEELTGERLIQKMNWVRNHIEEEKIMMEKVYKEKIPQIYLPISYIKQTLRGEK